MKKLFLSLVLSLVFSMNIAHAAKAPHKADDLETRVSILEQRVNSLSAMGQSIHPTTLVQCRCAYGDNSGQHYETGTTANEVFSRCYNISNDTHLADCSYL